MDSSVYLLQAVRACIRAGQVDWPSGMSRSDWQQLADLARQQQVLPMVLQGCYRAPAFLSQPQELRGSLLRHNRLQVAGQAMRAHALGELWQQLEEAGFCPVIMKGAACRSVYPLSGVRLSSDEDVLIPDGQFHDCLTFLKQRGFAADAYEADAFEVGLRRGDGLYIELHRTPFAPDDVVLGGCNAWFDGLQARAMPLAVDGVALRVMGPQDQMLLLILHAFKHLLGSGFGLRQVCDMVLWAEAYGKEMNWQKLMDQCESVRALGFAAAVFRLGEQHLGFDVQKACLPAELLSGEDVAWLLLRDLMSGGVYGTATLSRTHSANVTLNAVAADRQGGRSSLLQTVFPAREKLQGEYPYLKRAPLLLPVAWGSRLVRYGGEVLRRKDSGATDALRIGQERTELLRKLDVMD